MTLHGNEPARPASRQPGRGSLWIAIAAAAVAVAGCGSGPESPEQSGAIPAGEDPGPIHVHGLGINPADGSLFIATHTGLFRAPDGEPTAERVADRYQDTMGFTVVGPDQFLGSGHPDTREDLPPFLGLIRSDDGGESWESSSLLGRADFHVLQAAGDVVYGYGSDFETREQQLLVSSDGGKRWAERLLPEPAAESPTEESLLSIAIDPDDPSAIIASGQEALWASSDQGRNWSFLAADPGLLAWPDSDALYLVRADGEVATSTDEGSTWTATGSIDGEPAAFEASGDSLLAALHDGTVKQSSDGGETWTVRSTP